MNPFRYATVPHDLPPDAVLTTAGLQFRLAFERHLELLGKRVWPDGAAIRIATNGESPLLALRRCTPVERGIPAVRCNAGIGAPHFNRCRIKRLAEQSIGSTVDEWSLLACDVDGYDVVLAPRSAAVNKLTTLAAEIPSVLASQGFRHSRKDKTIFVGERTSILSCGGALTAVRRDAVVSELRICVPFMTSVKVVEWLSALRDKE